MSFLTDNTNTLLFIVQALYLHYTEKQSSSMNKKHLTSQSLHRAVFIFVDFTDIADSNEL